MSKQNAAFKKKKSTKKKKKNWNEKAKERDAGEG